MDLLLYKKESDKTKITVSLKTNHPFSALPYSFTHISGGSQDRWIGEPGLPGKRRGPFSCMQLQGSREANQQGAL